MEEDIKILEEMISRQDKNAFDIYRKASNTKDYLGTITGKEILAVEAVINRLKEDEAIIKEMVEHIASSAIVDDMVCMYKDCDIGECDSNIARECTEQYFRKKVKDERNEV